MYNLEIFIGLFAEFALLVFLVWMEEKLINTSGA